MANKDKIEIPELLYKFKSVKDKKSRSYLTDIIANNRIYIPLPSELNDPCEGVFKIKGQEYNPNIKHVSDDKRILSLSERSNINSMWAYYGDNNEGVCLEFKRQLLIPVDSVFRKVIYEPEPPLIDNLNDIKRYLQKSSFWRIEREWRYLTDSNARFLSFENQAISKIFLGSKMDINLQKDIIEIVKKRYINTKPPKVILTRYAKSSYDIVQDKILFS